MTSSVNNPTYISLLPAVETHQGSGTLRVPYGALPKALCWKRSYKLTVNEVLLRRVWRPEFEPSL